MFANFLRGPDAKTVSLETIGLVMGSKSFGDTGSVAQFGQRKAQKTAKQIGKVLNRDGEVLEPELRQFLNKAQRALTKLGETPDSVGTGKYEAIVGAYPGMLAEKYAENPAWKPAVTAFQDAMLPDATATFERLFRSQAYAAMNSASDAAIDKLAKKDPLVAIAKAYAGGP